MTVAFGGPLRSNATPLINGDLSHFLHLGEEIEDIREVRPAGLIRD